VKYAADMPEQTVVAPASSGRLPVRAAVSWTLGGAAVTFGAVWLAMLLLGHEPLGPARDSAIAVLASVVVTLPAMHTVHANSRVPAALLLLASIGAATLAFALAWIASNALGGTPREAAIGAACAALTLVPTLGLVSRRGASRPAPTR
jgi:hypothetical protein